MVVPVLRALLPQLVLQVLGNQHLLLHALLLNQLVDLLVFPFGLQPFDKIWIQDPQPLVLALLVTVVRKVAGQELPAMLFQLPH